MRNHFDEAIEEARKEGRNPTLAELCERVNYMMEWDKKRALVHLKQTLRDFSDYAVEALEDADEVDLDDPLKDIVAEMLREAQEVLDD